MMEFEQVVGVAQDGDEEGQCERHASVLGVCRCTVTHQSETPPPRSSSRHNLTWLLTWGADRSLLPLPCSPKSLGIYSV